MTITKSLQLAAAGAMLLTATAFGQEVKSPDGRIAVQVVPNNGAVTYRVSLDGRPFIEPSPLGLDTSIGDFSTKLTPTGTRTATIDQTYTLPHGKTREVRYRANELTSTFTHADGNGLEIIFRVSDRDVAFAFRLTSKDRINAVIRSEKTGFRLPAGATTFITPQAPAGTGFGGSKPSYEEDYTLDEPVGTKSKYGLGYTFPALFRLGDDGWALISETGVGGRYVGTRLGETGSDRLYRIAFPEQNENSGVGSTTAAVPLPAMTSWKTITVGRTLRPIVESTAATDLVTPLYAPSETYKPGRATWSWLLWQDVSTLFEEQKQFIDLAAAMKFEYILIDSMWDGQIGRGRIAELAAYGKTKGVSLMLWYNSNGTANGAPQTPRNLMDNAPDRHREMAWMKSIGVKGIKVDFFGGDKQTTIKLYEDILTDANLYGINVNFHGATLPRGWERMYPNYMTSEATLASENVIFFQEYADKEARLSTLTPFTRNAVGPMDFGPVYFNKRLTRDQKNGTYRRTTDAYQAATAVIYQSPIQHFGITPNNLTEQPAGVLDFLRAVPTVWDETRLLDGYPGRFVALARRSGERWYVAATNAEPQAKDLRLKLPELAGKTLTLIRDNANRTAAVETITVDNEGRVSLRLEASGGAVLY